MAELFSIQRIPAGLLQLLGMRGTGKNPGALSDQVIGTLDLRQAYQLDQLDTEASAFVTGPSGTNAVITVPDNEWWVVTQILAIARVDGILTTFIESHVQISQGRQGRLTVARETYQNGDNSVLPDNAVVHCGVVLPYPMIVSPAATLASVVRFVGGANADTAVQAVFARLR